MLAYLLLQMHSATWVAPSGAGFVYIPRDVLRARGPATAKGST